MSFLMAILLGLVQGVAEFLPISSSGHLSILQNFFALGDVQQEHLFFDVLLHFGTFISVCAVYRKDIAEMLREFLGLFSFRKRRNPQEEASNKPGARRLILMLIAATLPLVLILPIKGFVEGLYYNTYFIAVMLLVTGLVLFLSDRAAKGKKNEKNASMLDAVLVGCAQAVAVVPGLSRSGSTIAAGMVRGFDRKFAVRFSFLLSLPAVLGANILSLLDALQKGFDLTLLPAYLLGVITAMVSGYFSIGLVRMLAAKGKFGNFAYYCWGVGALVLLLNIIL